MTRSDSLIAANTRLLPKGFNLLAMTPVPSSSPIKTCVLGVGLAGLTFHVPYVLALSELFTLQSVLERNPKSPGGKVHDRFGVTTKIHRELGQVLSDPEVELVIVGTPNETHYPFAKAALEAGKHGMHLNLSISQEIVESYCNLPSKCWLINQ